MHSESDKEKARELHFAPKPAAAPAAAPLSPVSPASPPASVDEQITARLQEKIDSHQRYGFDLHEAGVLNILFDLMQEYQSDELLNRLPCLLLKLCCGIASEYYSRGDDDSFTLRSTPVHGDEWLPPPLAGLNSTLVTPQRVCLPVRGRFAGDNHDPARREILGLLVLYPRKTLTSHELLFFEKFSNRLGFSLHNHAMARRNLDHIEFVRTLVRDIGHNVLGPNMYFKLLLNQLTSGLVELGDSLQACAERGPGYEQGRPAAPDPLAENLKARHNAMLDLMSEIQQNFGHSSLFLESLLRESHFTQGRYVLRTSRMNLAERVVKGQFNNYLPMFKSKEIEASLEIRGGCDTPEPDCCPLCLVEADFGLISQVPANMFSNALKYATPTAAAPRPFMHCAVFPIENWRPKNSKTPAQPGLCVEVLTSGEHIKADESNKLFEKYFRASNTTGISGTGKGLHFVNEIVEQHGGETGYRPDPRGNVFYFILPCAAQEE